MTATLERRNTRKLEKCQHLCENFRASGSSVCRRLGWDIKGSCVGNKSCIGNRKGKITSQHCQGRIGDCDKLAHPGLYPAFHLDAAEEGSSTLPAKKKMAWRWMERTMWEDAESKDNSGSCGHQSTWGSDPHARSSSSRKDIRHKFYCDRIKALLNCASKQFLSTSSINNMHEITIWSRETSMGKRLEQST